MTNARKYQLGLCVALALAVAAQAASVFDPFSLLAGKFAPFTKPINGPVVQSLTNVQKLSLPANTPVGTRVQVTDGFVVSGVEVLVSDEMLGFYVDSGTTQNGKKAYFQVPFVNDFDAQNRIDYTGTHWQIGNGNEGVTAFEDGDETDPWNAVLPGITLTHPAVQELTAPSTAQGGVFVLEFGIYSKQGMANGKDYFTLLGESDSPDLKALTWNTSINVGSLENVACWTQRNGDGDVIVYSLSNVATPDLATNWKNASDDSPASITVASVTQGELDAGVTVNGAGTSTVSNEVEVDGAYPPAGTLSGRNKYTLLPFPIGASPNPLHSIYYWVDNDIWSISDFEDGNCFLSTPPLAFPWQNPFYENDSNPPAPSVTRNDVASEANWEVVTP